MPVHAFGGRPNGPLAGSGGSSLPAGDNSMLRVAGPPVLSGELGAEKRTLPLRGTPHPGRPKRASARRAGVLARWIVVGWSLLVLTLALGPCCEGVAGLLLPSHGSQRFVPVQAGGVAESPPGSDEHHHCDRVPAAATMLDSRDAGSTLLDARAPSLPSTPVPEGAFGRRCPPLSTRALPHLTTRLYLRLRRLLE